ncbi:Tyrosine-protein phosphatase non-receptor type 3 [Merluccius polli]|uniref:protein-tyrosine-phosphatase n=1 Tax=Merluccius polli TaxID=89951 RepID=A0AA47MWE5_MERPO|nr:Tyrosine-protein phosphatase non-receptor type 3 [Merluccius polli]
MTSFPCLLSPSDTYHIRDEWRSNLPGQEVLPVDGHEECMILQFFLKAWKRHGLTVQSRQQRLGCRRHALGQLQRGVDDLLKHLCSAATVEWRLWEIRVSGDDKQIISHQSIEHLKQHGAQAPPVHRGAVGVALQDLRGQSFVAAHESQSSWVHWSSGSCEELGGLEEVQTRPAGPGQLGGLEEVQTRPAGPGQLGGLEEVQTRPAGPGQLGGLEEVQTRPAGPGQLGGLEEVQTRPAGPGQLGGLEEVQTRPAGPGQLGGLKEEAESRDEYSRDESRPPAFFTFAEVTRNLLLLKQDEGAVLLGLVCDHLGLLERQLFNLQLRELGTTIASITTNTHSPRWLEPEKPLKKQMKGLVSPFYLNFRVRFFISDPNSLQNEQTRHLYFLQISSDIREGRLQCPLSAAVVLASYAVQSELGDHSKSCLPGYLSKSHFLPEQDDDFLSKVEDLHPQHKGLKQSEAELCFLNTARTLELYGVELHAAMDSNNVPLLVGLASSGVAVFCNMICSSFFPWGNIIKISFKRKRFLVHLKRKHGETQDCEVSLVLGCPKSCKTLWRSSVDHHSFFSSSRSVRSPKHNNYSSSTVQAYSKLITQHLGLLGNSKTESGPVCHRVVGGMVWNPVLQRSLSSEYLETKSLPSRSPPNTPNWYLLVPHSLTIVLKPKFSPIADNWVNWGNYFVCFYCGRRSPRVRHAIRKPRPSSVELTNDLKDMSEGEDVFYTYRVSVGSSRGSEGEESPQHNSAGQHSQESEERSLNVFDISTGDEENGNTHPHKWDKPPLGDGDLLLVRIAPDHEGKFGFNVKGGVDQKMPLAISHVKPDSPAGRCEPKLLDGDLVVLINGRDISEHTHDQVVMFIKASRESHSRELALLIRRKGPGRVAPLLQFPPALSLTGQSQADKPLSPGQAERASTLEDSMRQLERGLQSGTLSFHFENLYRRKHGLLLGCSRLPQNMEKNRYKDVLPYDVSRVVLQDQEDYINASHITVAPPASGVCLRYIAAQGPLPHTATHFWQCVWEQRTHTIIMLTTLTERGRTKCHQYWPHPAEVRDYGCLRVSCHSEECTLAYVTRRFTLTHTQRAEERAVTHLQYVAWPDHGVPDDPSDFLQFVNCVRDRRRGEETLMVHCSAGIGRTGVLITMETALALLEQGQPVFPLDMVRTLRDQRAMMVQTTCQFLFVCEAILRVYKERQKRSSTP